MKFIVGKPREQMVLVSSCLDELVGADNEVRVIDLFVGSLDLKSFGFKLDYVENGRPAYHPSELLTLFIYGYLNRIRSSRALERECGRNVELMWLKRGRLHLRNTVLLALLHDPQFLFFGPVDLRFSWL